MIMAIAPEKLAGWNFAPPKQSAGIFLESSLKKPVLGGWFGQGQTPNLEQLIASNPDLVVLSGTLIKTDQQKVLEKLKTPLCQITLDTLEDYPNAFRQMGKWLGNPQRGEKLADAFTKKLADLAAAKSNIAQHTAFKTVYYAQSNSGLATECQGSIHAETLPWAGAINPHICMSQSAKESKFGRVDISFEELLRYNPDAIVTQEYGFYKSVYQSPQWQSLKAVQNKQVFFMPQAPFRWMDRPPTFMRALAAQWLMSQLYPQLTQWDMTVQTDEFMQLFFDIQLSDTDIANILTGKIIDERQ
jgi:iron complex transport system substrate-binding protein